MWRPRPQPGSFGSGIRRVVGGWSCEPCPRPKAHPHPQPAHTPVSVAVVLYVFCILFVMSGSYPVPRPFGGSNPPPSCTNTAITLPLDKAPSSPASPTSRLPQSSASSKSNNSTYFQSRFPQHRRHQSAFAVMDSSSDNFCPGVKRGLCFATSGPSASVKAVLRNPMPLTDHHEFDTLPPAIRRKVSISIPCIQSDASLVHVAPYLVVSTPYPCV